VLRCLVVGAAVLLLPLFGSAQCLTTLPPNPSFVPPKPYETTAPNNTFWYGTDALWTALNANGKWESERNTSKDGVYSTKLVFWSRDFDWHTEPEPKLILTGKRLDGDSPSIAVAHANPVYVTGHKVAIMTLVTIPTTGCWEITAHYNGHTLSFVVSVEP
jgi:hypothetical protein